MATFEEILKQHEVVAPSEGDVPKSPVIDDKADKPDETVAVKPNAVASEESVLPPVDDAAKGEPTQATPSTKEPGKDNPPPTLDAETVLSFLEEHEDVPLKFISTKLGREISSIQELAQEDSSTKTPDLPESVSKYLEYYKETGRGLKDFMQAQRDWANEPKESVVMEYIRQTEGLDGELLQEYYDLEFRPDEDEVSEREVKKAKINFEKSYQKAVKFLNGQKEKFYLPDETTSFQRKAEDQTQQQKQLFSQQMEKAIDQMQEISVGDFSFKVVNPTAVKEKYKNIDSIMAGYMENNGFDYQRLARVLYAGENIVPIATAYAEKEKAKMIEESQRKMQNKVDVGSSADGNTSINPQEAVNIFRKYF